MDASDKIAWKPTPLQPVEAIEAPDRKQIADVGESSKDTRFKDLLEDIERLRVEGQKLGKEARSSDGAATEDLGQALDLADRTHENAMDMRRRLEHAFSRHMKS